MATLVLGAVGSAIGTGIGGSILGVTAATIGGFVGSSLGSMIDAGLVAGNQNQRFEGARLDAVRVTSSAEGVGITRLFGRMRVAGNIIWATDYEERNVTTTIRGPRRFGLFGPRASSTTVEYFYSASFAVGLCEGPITGIGRVWADGKLLDISGNDISVYLGNEEQPRDPLIQAKMGAARTPAYRGLAYIVFEDLDLEDFGNRIPQLTFEVYRPIPDQDVAEGCVRAVTVIPASGEFVYAVQIIESQRSGLQDGIRSIENAVARISQSDFVTSIDHLQELVPGVESVSLVVAWFGNDLRAGNCTIRPGVEVSSKSTTPEWSVNGISRAQAYLVSSLDGRPVYGGTPSDFSVVQAIKHLKARGYRVTFYPFLLMDVPENNTLPNPYSDNAAQVGQPAFPWRGRITCSPAAGFAGSADQTPAGTSQVDAFFGSATPANFSVSGETVSWSGGADFGLRRMILHYAHLCAAAGGVDAFIIGSELRSLTSVRGGSGNFAAVTRLRNLASDVRSIVGPGTKISYAADWSEYSGHQPGDGSGDVFFHLDPLWADPVIDFVGIDNYMPLSDWRDGFDHEDAQAGVPSIYDRGYLQGNIEGGEGFEWFYATLTDRLVQNRTPITDGASGKPWVFRNKDLRSWWSNQHFNRPRGIESATPTAWVPQSKPFWFTELGCPAIDRGTNQPNVFFDPKSSESFVPYFSRGYRDDAIQRAYLEATYLYWSEAANNPVSSVNGARMVNMAEGAAWAWDARPYPYFPSLKEIWADADNWQLGHWLTGRLGSVSLAALVRHLCKRAGLPESRIDVSGLHGAVEGYAITAIESPRNSIGLLMRHFGFDAIESEGVIRFVMRGSGSRATVTLDDLVASSGDASESFELTRGQETELPLALKWQLSRSDEDYDAAVVEAQRITVESARIMVEAFPFAVPPEMSERQVARALNEAWVGRERATFRLPPSFIALDASDVITLEHDTRGVDFRIASLSDGLDRALEAIRIDRELYDLPVAGSRATSLALLTPFTGALVQFLDLPVLFDNDEPHQPLMGIYAQPWPGALAVWRSSSTDGFTEIGSVSQRTIFGSLLEPLEPGPSAVFDLGNELVIELVDGTISSVSDALLFAGANSFAIQTDAGDWEIVQAGTVELIGERRYKLTRLLRGIRGTERFIDAPKSTGNRVLLISSALVPVPISTADLALPWNWRIGPVGMGFADPRMIGVQHTPTGEGLRPFSPVHVAQPSRRGRVPGDFIISWVRRDRDLGADNWAAAEIPMTEPSQAYEVDILNGANVLRTLPATTPSVVYTQADQVSDFGAALAPGDTLRIRIVQLSATFGRGAPADVILQF